jgi:hypothetical protein
VLINTKGMGLISISSFQDGTWFPSVTPGWLIADPAFLFFTGQYRYINYTHASRRTPKQFFNDNSSDYYTHLIEEKGGIAGDQERI